MRSFTSQSKYSVTAVLQYSQCKSYTVKLSLNNVDFHGWLGRAFLTIKQPHTCCMLPRAIGHIKAVRNLKKRSKKKNPKESFDLSKSEQEVFPPPQGIDSEP